MAYPSTIDSFSTKATGNTIAASHVNDLQTAVVSLETKVGITGSAVTGTLDYKLTSASSTSPGHKHVTADITDAGSYISTGLILPYAGSSAPTGFLLCDGSAVSRSTYAALFALTSTTYGVGDGSTTFNIPDLRSRMIVGVGTGTKKFTFASRSSDTITVTGAANNSINDVQTGQSVVYTSTGSVITGLTSTNTYYMIRVTATSFKLASSYANAIAGTAISLSSDGTGTQLFTRTLTAQALADTGGEESHTLITSEMPAHTHAVGRAGGGSGGTISTLSQSDGGTPNQFTSTSAGGDVAHNNMSPYLALTYVIKT